MSKLYPSSKALLALLGLLALHFYLPAVIEAQDVQEVTRGEPEAADLVWVLISAALVFFMQGGFLCLEVGMVRERSIVHVATKNIIDTLVVTIIYFAVGFGLMFGHSRGGIVGSDMFFLDGLIGEDTHPMGWTFWLFQLGFAGTAVTIVSGALNERIAFVPYLIMVAVMSILIYPVFGHWVWGGLYAESNTDSWLASLGFLDFAGSTAVHSIGAWVALVGIALLGPRRGRYAQDGRVLPITAYNLPISMLGVLILWLGWFGFNGGSTLSANSSVGLIIGNTCIAAAAAGLSAFLHSSLAQGKADLYEKLMGGTLGGLVAITACCDIVSPGSAMVIGLIAGLIHNLSYDLVIKSLKLDDAVGAVPVHGFCGVFGTLAVALFGSPDAFPNGNTWLDQLYVQAIGCLAAFVFAVFTSAAIFALLKAVFGLRVSEEEEEQGINLAGSPVNVAAPFSQDPPID